MAKTRSDSGRRSAAQQDAPPAGERRRPGRPRSADADQAIIDAAVEILTERGFGGLTATAVIERSGVARATVYRRYPSREALLLAASNGVKGRPPYPLTDDVVADLRRGARAMAGVFDLPRFRQFLPAFVAEALTHPEHARTIMGRLAPNFPGISEQYGRLGRSSGLRTDVDPEVVPTLLIGGLLFRLLSTGRAADEGFADQLADVLIRGLSDAARNGEPPNG